MRDIEKVTVYKCVSDYGDRFVKSFTHRHYYQIEINIKGFHVCECPDFIFRGKPSNTPCKHIDLALKHTCMWQGDETDVCPGCGGEVEKVKVYK